MKKRSTTRGADSTTRSDSADRKDSRLAPPVQGANLVDLPMEPIQGMFGVGYGGFDGMAALNDLDNESGSEESEEDDPYGMEDWTFDDVTTEDFRGNHVTDAENLAEVAREVAERREIDVSTTVKFTAGNRASMVNEIKDSTRVSNEREEGPFNSLQGQETGWAMDYVEVTKVEPEGDGDAEYQVGEVSNGNMRYAAQGIDIGFGRKIYEVNHLDGMT